MAEQGVCNKSSGGGRYAESKDVSTIPGTPSISPHSPSKSATTEDRDSMYAFFPAAEVSKDVADVSPAIPRGGTAGVREVSRPRRRFSIPHDVATAGHDGKSPRRLVCTVVARGRRIGVCTGGSRCSCTPWFPLKERENRKTGL